MDSSSYSYQQSICQFQILIRCVLLSIQLQISKSNYVLQLIMRRSAQGLWLLLLYITLSSYDCSKYNSIIMVNNPCGLGFGPDFGSAVHTVLADLVPVTGASSQSVPLGTRWPTVVQKPAAAAQPLQPNHTGAKKKRGRASPIRTRSLFIYLKSARVGFSH